MCTCTYRPLWPLRWRSTSALWGAVMKPYNDLLSETLVTRTRVGTSTTITSSTRTGMRTTLNVSPSPNPGDRKSPTPITLSKERDRYIHGSNFVRYKDGSGDTLETGGFGSSSWQGGAVSIYDANVYNQALSNLYEQLRGDIDLSIDLLQAGQARDMVNKSLRGLANLGRTVRAMRRSPLKTASNLWLEYVYGWKPLASSIYGTMKRFQEGPPQGFYRVTGRGRDNRMRTVKSNFIGNIPKITIEHTSLRCIISANFSVEPSVLQNLASLSSLNPVSVAWELVPYSFVIDWVVDIGGYLRNLESALLYRSSFKQGYSTEGYEITGTTTINGVYDDGIREYIVDAKGDYRWSGKQRKVAGSSPLPRVPTPKIDLGATRLLSAASLLYQQLGRR